MYIKKTTKKSPKTVGGELRRPKVTPKIGRVVPKIGGNGTLKRPIVPPEPKPKVRPGGVPPKIGGDGTFKPPTKPKVRPRGIPPRLRRR